MYRQSIITFVDILGFKDLVKSSGFAQLKADLDIIKIFSGYSPNEDGEGYEPKVIQFSDSIIRIRPIDSKANSHFRYGIAHSEFLDLAHMQGELINHGILVRGGVTLGEIHWEDGNIFGPGFVQAYELESIYARHPRIVIDPILIQAIKTDKYLRSRHNSLKEEVESIKEIVRVEDDGVHSIDYLGVFPGEMDEPGNIPTYLETHKNLILSKKAPLNELNPISAKYLWLARYHNSVIEKFGEQFFNSRSLLRSDFMIHEHELPVMQTLNL